nr:hypothetical protein PHYPA_017907 [Physcomitrium patens]
MMSEQVKDGLSDRLRRDVYEGYYGADVEEDKSNVEPENSLDITGKDHCGQKGNKRTSRISRDAEEDGKTEDSCGVGNSPQPMSGTPQPKNAKRSRITKRRMPDHEERNSEEEHTGDISGDAELATSKVKQGLKEIQSALRTGNVPDNKTNIGARSSFTRSAKVTGSSVQPKIGDNQRRLRHIKEVEPSENEGLDDESSGAGSSDGTFSDSSQESDRGKHAKSITRTRVSKRKSDEIVSCFEKKVRRRGSRLGNSGPGKSSREARSEVNGDFVMEGNIDVSSCNENDKGIIDGKINGISGDNCAQYHMKQRFSKKGEVSRIKQKPQRDGNSLDEEVCSVCEFAGAADSMLLCDGETCDEAFHLFCLKFPLQAIPEGDWLCPLCLYVERAKEAIGTIVKRTSKLRTRMIPPLKKIEGIFGFRKGPSLAEGEGQKQRKLQYLVKWCSLSHRHDTWVPEEWLLFADKTRLATYQRKSSVGDGEEMSDERRPEWVQIDRIIASRNQDNDCVPSSPVAWEAPGLNSSRKEYLVKWTNIEYNGSTWEEENNHEDMQEAISKFIERHNLAEKRACTDQADQVIAPAITEQPKYISGGVLHDYQLQGLKWLLSNFQQRKSVILADEMGLGKTIQAVSFIMALKYENLSNKPVLVIGPKSTLVGWEQEFGQWGADLNTVIYQGDKESRTMIRNYEFFTREKIPLFDVLVTSYDLAMLDSSLLEKMDWACIIVDEGHRVKNTRSKLGILLRRQKADFRLLLTGTPVQNTLTELFALLHFLDPVEFPDPERSAQEFSQVDALSGAGSKGEGGVDQQVSRLHKLLTPRMLRRLKADVMQGMIPGKKYVEVLCALTPLQRHLYGAILKKNYKQLNRGNTTGKKRSLNFILMDLKMVCNHPYLFPGKEPEHGDADELFRLLITASGKLQVLAKLLPRLKEGGHRVLLFSQMKSMLDILEDFLSHLDYKFCRIDGSTPASGRQKQIADFNSANSDVFIFLISTRAGGLGINLPSADTVIIYDPDFNPFVDLQAQARAHRIGQRNVVLVYQLITKCSVEEKITERSRQKLAMENLVMSSSEKDTAEDVNTLLLHGARKVLEQYDVECTSVKWTDEKIELLLNRDISDTKEMEDGAGYLGTVQEPGGMLGALPLEGSPLKTGLEWDDLLGKLAEQDMEAEEAKLGRGKRQRRKIQYKFEPNINAHEDEEGEGNAFEGDPTCSGAPASSSGSDSDVSLDDKKMTGTRGPYLTKVKSMKEEQGVSSLPPQQHPGPGASELPKPDSSTSIPLVLPKHFQPSEVISPRPSLVHINEPSAILPTYCTPSLSPWSSPHLPQTTSAVVSSNNQSPGLNYAGFSISYPHTWNEMSASAGSFQSSKASWEYSAPRFHGLSGASVSLPQPLQPLQSPLSCPKELPIPPARSLVHGPAPHYVASHKVSESLSPKDLKITLTSSIMQQGTSPKELKVTSTSTSIQPERKPHKSPMVQTAILEIDRRYLSSPLEPNVMPFPMPKSHSLPYKTNIRPVDVVAPQEGTTFRGVFSQVSNERASNPEYLSLAEVLRQTGSHLSSSQASPTFTALQDAKGLSLEEVLRQTGSPLSRSQASPRTMVLPDAKGLSLEDVLRKTGSTLTATKRASTTGTSSQLFEEAKNMSLQDVLRRTGATNIPTEELNKRAVPSAPGAPSQLLQDTTKMSLEEVLRQTGSKLIAPKRAVSPKHPVPHKDAVELLVPQGSLPQNDSSSTETNQSKSAVIPSSSQVSLDAKSNSSQAVTQKNSNPLAGIRQIVSSQTPSQVLSETQISLSIQSAPLCPKIEAEHEV